LNERTGGGYLTDGVVARVHEIHVPVGAGRDRGRVGRARDLVGRDRVGGGVHLADLAGLLLGEPESGAAGGDVRAHGEAVEPDGGRDRIYRELGDGAARRHLADRATAPGGGAKLLREPDVAR